jgi:hypothetical protein
MFKTESCKGRFVEPQLEIKDGLDWLMRIGTVEWDRGGEG